MSKWREMFQQQAAYGRRWKEIFKENHDSTIFLDRSDAVAIIKTAQLEVYDELLEEFKDGGPVSNMELLIKISQKRNELALSDISALGLRGLDIEALRVRADQILKDLSPTELDEWIQEYRKKNGKTP